MENEQKSSTTPKTPSSARHDSQFIFLPVPLNLPFEENPTNPQKYQPEAKKVVIATED